MKLEEAQSEFITIGDRLGVAQCLHSLGDISQMQDQYEEARLKLEGAWSAFTHIGFQTEADLCRKKLDDIARVHL